MNKIEELLKDLKIAYLNYENEDLKETLKYLDRITETILKDDESLKEDIFWKNLSIDVFKAVVLNNFYNKNELDGNKLDSLLADESLMKTNIKEFCINFRNNDLIDFINRIENIADNPLKSVIKIIMNNIGRLNIKNITTEYSNSKIQKINCFCGKSFEFDWDKIPTTDKFVYVRCPDCNGELKLKNMYYKEEDKSKIQKIDCFCGKSFEFDWSKIPNTEKICYIRCSNCNSELKRGNPFYVGNSDNANLNFSNHIELIEYWNKEYYSKNFNKDNVLNYLKKYDKISNLCVDACDSRYHCCSLVRFIIENFSIKVLPTTIQTREFFGDETDIISGGFYGYLCNQSEDRSLNIKERDSYYDLIKDLRKLGFESSYEIEYIGDGRRSGIKKDYSILIDRILNKKSFLDFAYMILDGIDEITETGNTITFKHSYTAMHGIDEFLKITKTDQNFEMEIESKEIDLNTLSTEIRKLKSALDKINFKNYKIENRKILISDLFVENGNYILEFDSLTEW